jgi:uncharacterized membrane protein (DUF2068 family)
MASAPHDRSSLFLVLIGITKLIKASLLIAVGVGIRHLLKGDAEEILKHWVHAIRVDPDNHYIHLAIAKVTGLDEHTLRRLSLGTFAYAGLLTCEGVGLVLRKRWAEYLTIVATTSLLPLEIYENIHHLTIVKLIVFLLNLVIVAYLVYQLCRTHPHRPSPPAASHNGPSEGPNGFDPLINPPLPKSID